MSKEIVKRLKDSLDYEFNLTFSERKELLSYIEQLEKENDRLKEIVENLTTMTVNGDTKQIKNTAQYKLEQLEKIIYKARKMIFDNYGVLDKYEIEMLDDILKGGSDE